MKDDIEKVAQGFINFAEETRDSSLLYSTLSVFVAQDEDLLKILLSAPPSQRRANLLFAAVHDLLLAGEKHPLARHYASIVTEPDAIDDKTFAQFRDLCLANQARICQTLTVRNTQTNEVRRSAAILPILQRLSTNEPIALIEVGASAGLNLLVDHYRYNYNNKIYAGPVDSPVEITCALRGSILPPMDARPPHIGFRLGLDLRPLDVCNNEDARWLRACVWPEQIERMALLNAAMDVARQHPPQLVQGDAIRDLEEVVARVPDDLPICLFHSATAAYLTDAQCEEFVAAIDRIGKRHRLHWLSLEGNSVQSFGARLPFEQFAEWRADDRATDIVGLLGYARWTDTGREDTLLARVNMHGQWIEWLQTEF